MLGMPGEGDAVIIVPPFAAIQRPSLAAHILQACAKAAGFAVRVFYANLHFAARIGVDAYDVIADGPQHSLIGERFFARSAHGLPPFGNPQGPPLELPAGYQLDIAELLRLEAEAPPWADEIAEWLASRGFQVAGATSTFEQTNASLALLGRLKRAQPGLITILGGANCDGLMAEGVDSIASTVDHIFSGESESSFPEFLRALAAGERPAGRIVQGAPCRDLDAIPTPDFSEFFEQRAAFLPDGGAGLPPPQIAYESSRGCWWGQKHHCTFCGLNGSGMAFREKSPDRVLGDLKAIADTHGTRLFTMTDNIMPHGYFKTLLPRLAAEGAPVELFYEQKANLSLDDVLALKAAGVTSIQPGIEALSTRLLRRMDKGVPARQNVTLLRLARAVGLDVEWNLLWDFPGDELEAYEETLALVPLLGHLQPPHGLIHLSVDRFSPYYDRAASYGIRDLHPHPSYRAAFPDGTDCDKVAYRFVADYDSGARGGMHVIEALGAAVQRWREGWARGDLHAPTLRINRVGDYFVVRDTRGLPGGDADGLVLDETQARSALSPGRCTAENAGWVEQRLGAVIDGLYVPLLTALPSLLVAVDGDSRRGTRASAAARGEVVAPRPATAPGARMSLPVLSRGCSQ